MKEELISKKDLLDLTNISYGQLYRWKRMEIIPEIWFIKKSSYTGQETYFPKEKILDRIEKIKDMKELYSLDDLARFFSPDPTEIEVSSQQLTSENILGDQTFKLWESVFPKENVYNFNSILTLYVIEQLLKLEKFDKETCIDAMKFLLENINNIDEMSGELLAVKKEKIIFWMLAPTQGQFIVEEKTSILVKVNVLNSINKLKVQLSKMTLGG
jgi:hypothetical protein